MESMDCDKLGPGKSGLCQSKKNEYSLSYPQRKAVCGAACDCEGAVLDNSERINNCSLEPANLCQCR